MWQKRQSKTWSWFITSSHIFLQSFSFFQTQPRFSLRFSLQFYSRKKINSSQWNRYSQKTESKIKTHVGEIKTRTMDIPTETAELFLELSPHFRKVIIVAFVRKFIFLSLGFVYIFFTYLFWFQIFKTVNVGTKQLSSC